jgi:FixJ family two-component response regulator
MSANVVVSVVDDDESIRDSLPPLLRAYGFAARAFASAEDFLASDQLATTQYLVLDVAMPGMSGPDLHHELARRARAIPTIFITAQEGERLRGQLMALGAVACLFKPFDPLALVEALEAALPGN